MNKDRFGINMKRWCREHEAYLAAHEASPELLALHLQKLRWLQHERLVHLIVTVMVVLVELFTIALVLLRPGLGLLPLVFMIVLMILLGFYFYHYFFLENTVQHWYILADELRGQLAGEEPLL